MKYSWILVLLTAAIYGLTGCASTGSSAGGDSVPGERVSEESRLAPGTGTTPNASVKW